MKLSDFEKLECGAKIRDKTGSTRYLVGLSPNKKYLVTCLDIDGDKTSRWDQEDVDIRELRLAPMLITIEEYALDKALYGWNIPDRTREKVKANIVMAAREIK